MLICLAFVPTKKKKKWPKPIQTNSDTLRLNEKILLGRALFFDPILSYDNSISCASCHSPFNAFAHSDHRLSHGIFDSIGQRNAPPLFNLAWQKNFTWDGRAHHIDMQTLAPINDPREMGENTKNIISKLKKDSLYKSLFFSAFQDSSIQLIHFLKAISAFELSLISNNSKYDQIMEGKDTFRSIERKGYKIFQKNCAVCHQEPLFSSYEFANNGLEIDSNLLDFGRGEITGTKEDSMTFKIPSLRNLNYTAPYMHDGRFSSIREVLNHYQSQKNTSIKNLKMALNERQKTELVAFLKTLNDTSFLLNPKNQYPSQILHR